MLIIGLGNLDRGDDGAGILVVRRLGERGLNGIEHIGPTLNLMDVWATSDRVVLVDAMVSGEPPGSIRTWNPWNESLRSTIFRTSTHEFGLAEVIELARTLNRLPSWVRIYGIEAAQFEAGTQPSEAVLSAVVLVANEIESAASFRGTSS
jgi:hydrogenase maturation protease